MRRQRDGCRAEQLYGWFLRLMPADFDSCRQDTLETFRDLYEAAQGRSRVAGWWLCVRYILLALVAAGREHWRQLTWPRWSPIAWSRALSDDTVLAARGLRRRPAFSLGVVVVVAFAIGATTAVFSVVDNVLLRPLPYPSADRLVYIDNGSHPGPLFETWQSDVDAFEALAAGRAREIDLSGQGPPLTIASAQVSRDFFAVFGARAAHGRLLAADEYAPGSRSVVLSAGLWQRRWGGDPGVVGQTVTLDGEAWTVAGVMSGDFRPPELVVGQQVDLWLPIDFSEEAMTRWDYWVLAVVGRLRPEVSLQAADAELDVIARAVAAAHPEERRNREGEDLMTPLVEMRRATVGAVEQALFLLLGAVTLLLLVGCANVAGLFLARGSERRREMSLRLALGAQPGRLATQLLVESVTLSLVGGLAGVFLAFQLVGLFEHLVPDQLPRFGEVAIDGRVLAAALAMAIFTGVAFGLAPALQAARMRALGTLRDASGGSTNSRGTQRARSLLVVAEVALALMLLVGASILGHSLVRLMSTELGFAPEGLSRLAVRLGDGYDDERRLQFAHQLLERVEGLPGVESAALGWSLPLDYTGDQRCCWRSRFKTAELDDSIASMVHPVTPGYFHTLGASLLAGRELSWTDTEGTPEPVILNRTLAAKLFPGQTAIGQSLQRGEKPLVVVGVVDDVRHYGPEVGGEHAVYVPYERYGVDEGLRLVVRSSGTALAPLADALRAAVWELDGNLPVGEIVTLEQQVARSLTEPRFYSMLLGAFASMALLLAAVGLGGTLLYAVNQRRRELGIRLAIGARGSDLLQLVLRQGLVLVAVGLGLGLLGTLALSRVLRGMIHGISATDPVTYATACAVLAIVAVGAAYLPARRAAQTDPIETLRAE